MDGVKVMCIPRNRDAIPKGRTTAPFVKQQSLDEINENIVNFVVTDGKNGERPL